MKVTIITVAFNSAATIGDTLRSVASQTYPDIEHIVIDGASTDGTGAVVQRIGRRVSACVSEPDHGIYDAMNKGLRLATGDLVGFLNADDLLADEEAIARLVRVAEASGADVLFSDLVYVRSQAPNQVVRRWRSGAFSRRQLRLGWMPPHPTFYIRRSRLAELGEFDTRLRISADYDFMLRALQLARIQTAYVPGIMVKMRLGGVSNRSWRAMYLKSCEDLRALQRSGVGGLVTLICKNVRKLPQFL